MATVADRIREGNEYVSAHIYALESQTVRDLYAAYQRAYSEMQQATAQALAAGTWAVADVAARERLLQQIAYQLDLLEREQAGIQAGALIDAYKAGLVGTAWNMDTSLMVAMGRNPNTLPLLPNEAIRAQALAPYAGQTFAERFRDNRADFELRMKRSLVQSQIQGEGVYEAQKRIAEALGIEIGRRTKADRAANQAMFARTEMIARTELLNASNNGARAAFVANRDLLRGYEILTAKDERVCPICGPLDGTVYDFSDKNAKRPPFHPRCRCTVIPALINRELEQAIAGKREPFTEWAKQRGLTKDAYGNAYGLRVVKPPVKAA